jgi:hypothetical protein
MGAKSDLYMKISAVVFGLLALFNLAIGIYHTILFTFQGSPSLFSIAYGIRVTATDMKDPARLLGSDAIEMYSILLGGYGALSLWSAIESWRGLRAGFWLNAFIVGIAQIATLYALVIPGRLTGANAYASFVLYGLAILLGAVSMARNRRTRGSLAVAFQPSLHR